MITLLERTTIAVLVLTAQVSVSVAQKRYDPQGVIHNQLVSLISSRYGPDYQYVEFTIFDTLISYAARDDEDIRDPYGTLRQCILYTTYKDNGDEEPNNFIVGMVKNGQIIWDNAPGTNANLGGDLLSAQDINDDGEVDLLFSEVDRESLQIGRPPFLYYIDILSWNGTRGRIVNAFGSEGKSVMLGDGSCELMDKDRNGILEVRSALPDIDMEWGVHKTNTYPYVTYGWNGSQYGLWPGVSQVAGDEYLPANRVSVNVRCSVRKTNTTYEYRYTVCSDSTSKQTISDIYIGGLDDTTSNLAPPLWQSGTSSYIGGRAFIKYAAGTYYLIHPGQTMGSFRTISLALPTIVRYHVQGYTPPVFGTREQERQNILNNSVRGYTLGTRDTSTQVVVLDFLDSLSAYTTQSRSLGWIGDQSTASKYLGFFGSAKTSLAQNIVASARVALHQVVHDVDVDSSSSLTSEAYALLRYNTEYLLSRLPAAPAPGLVAKLTTSAGTRLTTGSLQYYDGSWKDATNNNDGTFSVNTTRTSLSLRMTYEGGSQQKNNVPVGPDTVVFQTVNTQVKLQNSQGALIDTGTVQYYAGSWRTFGTTSSGVASKELLPGSYSFRMTYAFGSNDKQQDNGNNPVVVFSTTNTTVQLKNSQGAFIDQGSVQYYAGAWRNFGTTSNGAVSKELLPANYSFRMTYAYGSVDKQQNIGTNPTIVFNTVNTAVELRNSQGALMDGGTVQYYAGAWRSFGTTSGGSVSKELLPANYSFRMTHEYVSIDKAQNTSTNSTVGFSTVLCTIRVRNGQNQPVDNAIASYYSGAWRQIGSTVNGEIKKELLPANPTFRISYGGATQDKVQNLATNAVVEFVVQ